MSSAQPDPKPLQEIPTEESTKFIVFFPNSQHMIQVFFEGAVQIRVSDGKTMGSRMVMPDVNACAISKNGRWFVAAHDDRVTVWDTATKNKVCEQTRSQDLQCTARMQALYFTTLDISQDSSRAAIGDSHGSIVLLSIPTGEHLAAYSRSRGLYLDSLRFSPLGDYLAVGTAGGISGSDVTRPATLHILHTSRDQLSRYQEVPFGSSVKEVAQDERPIIVDWSSEGQQIFAGSHRSLVVVDLMSESKHQKDIPSFQTLSCNGGFILSTATPRTSSLGAYFWDPITFKELGFSIPNYLPLALSSDSSLLATLHLSADTDSMNVISIWSLY